VSEAAGRRIRDQAGLKLNIAAATCFLALLALPLLVIQRAKISRGVAAVIHAAQGMKPVDPGVSVELLKVAGRVKELETANDALKAEVSTLSTLAKQSEALRQHPVETGLEAALRVLKGRSRATLGKEGQLGIVLNLRPEEVEQVQPLLQAETEFVKLDAPAPAPAEPAAKPKQTVLIIDDDRLNRTILRQCIAELELNLLEAEHGEAAWGVLDRGTHVDLCLCDLMMPELDGFGFAKRVHADPRFENLDIIFCTASAEKEHIAQATELGIRQYVVKPFNKEDVIKNVRIALERAAARKDPMSLAQEKLGIDAESYAQLMEMLSREVTETLTFVRTALTRGQRRAAWTRINSLRGSSQMVGDHFIADSIVAVERELERGDVFFIITELEKLEEANRRMSQVATQLVDAAAKGSPTKVAPPASAPAPMPARPNLVAA
jgi:CheY-like chemotaxis protein